MAQTKVKQELINASFGNILEQIVYRADGRTITTSQGNITVPNVTAPNDITSTTFSDVAGTNIDYQPPTGASLVVYEANIQCRRELGSTGTGGYMAPNFLINFDGTDVTSTRKGYLFQKTWDEEFSIFLAMQITGGSDSIATEQVGTWTSAKTIKTRAAVYAPSYSYAINGTYHWQGTGATFAVPPVIKITAYS